METCKKSNVQNFTKLTHKRGISLIVLVITIIIIVILASAVILTISNNNPVTEANRARYESDIANMQAVFTNTVAKIMAKNQGVLNVKITQLNDITKGVKTTTGKVDYTIDNASNINNSSGTIIFGQGTNEETKFFTGKELPIYAAGDTKWYVDTEGIISLEVAKVKYGIGKQLDPGLYDENGVMLASFDELVNDYGINIEKDVTNDELSSGSYPGKILQTNEKLASGTKLILEDIEKIGDYAFKDYTLLKEIKLPDSIDSIGNSAFYIIGIISKLIKPELCNTA